ncbi:hypothetical protein ACSQ67_023788 [Phaseolus vulgaris]
MCNKAMTSFTFLFLFSYLLNLLPIISSATDTINVSQPLLDGSTLVSKDGTFEMGFFSPKNSTQTTTNRYLGIWYRSIPVRTVVWVANRENPVKDSSSKFSINTDGKLVILSSNNTLVWSANSTEETKAQSPIVQLLDSGNLVLRDEKDSNPQIYLWQSFDYPCDTFLPGMKIGWNLKTGLNRRLTAWKNWDDPSPGDFIWGMVLGNTTELVMWKGTSEYYRSGPWNGVRFNGKTTPLFNLELYSSVDEVYYTYNIGNKSLITRVVLNQSVYSRQRYNLNVENQTWKLYSSVPRDICDTYNLCGPYGNCLANESPPCQCLTGFKPKSVQNYEALDWIQGCVLSEAWSCGVKSKDGFKKFSGLKMPDTTSSWVDQNLTLEDCKEKCLLNCSCTAYANLDVRGDGKGCIIWHGALLDLRVASVPGQDLFIRMVASENGRDKKIVAVVIPVTLLAFVIVFIFTYVYWRKRKLRVRATNNFSSDKRLGQGGFGPVYWGTLEDGQEIAAKKLCNSTWTRSERIQERSYTCVPNFSTEILLRFSVAPLKEGKKCLVYEYMPNKSLDSFLFEDRPNMASVIFMLSSENTLPTPKEPGFLIDRTKIAGECSTSNEMKTSTNELTVTLLEAR